MNVKDENICRICFQTAENEFQIIDDVIRKMLGSLSLEMNFNVSKDPVICKNCTEILNKSYCFKSVCLGIDKQRHSFAIRKEEIKLELNDIHKHNEEATFIKEDSSIICGFCLNQLKTNKFVSRDVLMKEESLLEKLTVCMPEMDLNITKNAAICGLCRENLDCSFNFIQNCLDIEEKINRYLQDKGIVNDDKVKISDIQAFLFENSLDIEKYTVIKQEPPTIDESEYVYSDMYNDSIKTEELDIKDEVILNDNLSPLLKTDAYDDRHVVTHKAVPEKNIKCGMCSYKTRYKHYLIKHMTVHKEMSEENTFKCANCSYKTKYKECLKRHIVRRHISYECLRCKIVLRKHKVLLRGDKVVMYQCPTCRFEISRKDFLKSRMYRHKRTSKEIIYKCTMCTFEAKRKDQLKIHKLLHDP